MLLEQFNFPINNSICTRQNSIPGTSVPLTTLKCFYSHNSFTNNIATGMKCDQTVQLVIQQNKTFSTLM